MKAVKFLQARPNPRPNSKHTHFEAGRTYMLEDDSASHWVKRGIAAYVTSEASTARKSEADPAPPEPVKPIVDEKPPAPAPDKEVIDPVESAALNQKQESTDGNPVASTETVVKQDGGDTGQRTQPQSGNRGGRQGHSGNRCQ
jgi:outer membrane biosynthesis protein TonB